MLQESFSVASPKNSAIAMRVIPGHFTTNSAHISHYLDLSEMKTNTAVARGVARELAVPYENNALIETIVCMEGTEVIGTFMARELLREGMPVRSSGGEIHILTPMSNVNGQLMFPKSVYPHIQGKVILLLVASVSSGHLVERALECLHYYGGVPAGIAALFAATQNLDHLQVFSLFTDADIPGYQFAWPGKCPMCEKGMPLDAIVNNLGYMELP